MKKLKTILCLLPILAISIAFLVACTPPVTPDPITLDPVTPDPNGAATATAAIDAGIIKLIEKDFNGAKTSFAEAILADPASSDAKVWISLLDIASLSVDPTMVDLFANRMGVSNYPTSMNNLFGTTWFNANYYTRRADFIEDANGSFIRGDLSATAGPYAYSYFESTGSFGLSSPSTNFYFIPSDTGAYYASSFFTADSPIKTSSDTEFASFKKYNIRFGILDSLCQFTVLPRLERPAFLVSLNCLSNPAYPDILEYPLVLAANIVFSSPLGFNAVVDNVKSHALATTLDTIISRVESLDDTTRIVIPTTLLTAYSSADAILALKGATVSVGKAELLLWVAQLKLQRSFVQYLSSVDFSYDIASITGFLGSQGGIDLATDTTPFNGIPDQLENLLAAAPGIYSSNLLKERSATARAESKATFLEAVASIKAAAILLKTQWADSASYYNTLATTFEMPATEHAAVANMLQVTIDAATALGSAVSANTAFSIPNGSTVSTPTDFVWPGVAGTDTVEINPGAFWASNALDPRTWFETEGAAFKSYIHYDENHITPNAFVDGLIPWSNSMTMGDYGNPASNSDISSIQAIPAMKIKLSRIQAFYPSFAPPVALYFPMGVGSWSVYEKDSDPAIAVPQPPQAAMFLLDWINK